MAQQMLFCNPMNSILTNRLFDSFFNSDHKIYDTNNDDELNYKLNLESEYCESYIVERNSRYSWPGKTPPAGFEPATYRLTAERSAN